MKKKEKVIIVTENIIHLISSSNFPPNRSKNQGDVIWYF